MIKKALPPEHLVLGYFCRMSGTSRIAAVEVLSWLQD